MKDEGALMLALVTKRVVEGDERAALNLVLERFAHATLEHMMLELFLQITSSTST
jgi:hypothetical protein